MISLVTRAEDYIIKNHVTCLYDNEEKVNLEKNGNSFVVSELDPLIKINKAWSLTSKTVIDNSNTDDLEQAELRKKISNYVGGSILLRRSTSDIGAKFALQKNIRLISQQAPVTPDHVIRTKRVPMIGRNLDNYVQEYQAYFLRWEPNAAERKIMLDPAPRVLLDPELGLLTVGKTAKDAQIVEEIYLRSISVINAATDLGGYVGLSESHIFDVEYWDLEQAKLRKNNNSLMFSGEVVLVTGGNSGIGKACIQSFLKNGASVIGLDIDSRINTVFKNPSFLGLQCDVTDINDVKRAISLGVREFGGVDVLILNAGIFPKSERICDLSLSAWQKVMKVNLDANFEIMKEVYPFIKKSYKYGRIVIIGSKNVAAPGTGAAAYSVSKAALAQLSRVAALEWGSDGIRINTVHPNAVFDTAIWTDEVLASRAGQYGLSVDEYKKNNILKTEITSQDVANLVIQMAGPSFSKTTSSQVPVDGGNDRVI